MVITYFRCWGAWGHAMALDDGHFPAFKDYFPMSCNASVWLVPGTN